MDVTVAADEKPNPDAYPPKPNCVGRNLPTKSSEPASPTSPREREMQGHGRIPPRNKSLGAALVQKGLSWGLSAPLVAS